MRPAISATSGSIADAGEAHLHGDLPALLALADDPNLSPDMVATIAPDAHDNDELADLIHAVLDHPACSVGVAGQDATHRNAGIRLRVANFPCLLTSSQTRQHKVPGDSSSRRTSVDDDPRLTSCCGTQQ